MQHGRRSTTMTWRAFTLGLALLAGCATSPAPENIHFAKQRLVDYQQSGRYDADVARAAEEAKDYLRARLATPGPWAVVFDIDETALSNFPALKANDFGWIVSAPCRVEADGKIVSPCGILQWILLGTARPLVPVREVYEIAIRAGAAVHFVTGRPDTPEMRAATERNLREAGYAQWRSVVLKPTNRKLTTIEFKSGERRRLNEEGQVVVATIGDQQSDLDGGHAERGFLIPNPFYYIP